MRIHLYLPFLSLVISSVTMALGAQDRLGQSEVQSNTVAENQATQIQATIQRYQHHREAFPFLTCEFKYTSGRTLSLEDAQNGTFSQVMGKYECIWIYSKELDSSKCEMILKTEPFALTPVPQSTSGSVSRLVSGFSRRYLHRGSLHFVAAEGIANTLPPGYDTSSWGPSETPFSIGMMGENENQSPFHLVSEWLETGTVRFCGMKRSLMGANCIVVEGSPVRNSDFVHRRFYLDPARGFLAVQIETFLPDKGRISLGFATHIAKCSGDRWLPTRFARVINPDKQQGLPRAFGLIEVTRFDADNPPGDDDFYVTIPTSFIVKDPKAGQYIHEGETLHASELQDVLVKTIIAGQ